MDLLGAQMESRNLQARTLLYFEMNLKCFQWDNDIIPFIYSKGKFISCLAVGIQLGSPHSNLCLSRKTEKERSDESEPRVLGKRAPQNRGLRRKPKREEEV